MNYSEGGGVVQNGLDQKEKGLSNVNGRNKMGSLNIHVQKNKKGLTHNNEREKKGSLNIQLEKKKQIGFN